MWACNSGNEPQQQCRRRNHLYVAVIHMWRACSATENPLSVICSFPTAMRSTLAQNALQFQSSCSSRCGPLLVMNTCHRTFNIKWLPACRALACSMCYSVHVLFCALSCSLQRSTCCPALRSLGWQMGRRSEVSQVGP